MSTYHRARWGAIALGCLCAAGAGAILLQDIRHTGTVTVDHGLSVITLVGTIAAGHMATAEAARLRLIRAAALALLFMLGSAWCVLSTAGRQADGAAQARADVEAANRALILKGQELDAARQRLALATAEVARECRSGFGKSCAGWRATESERQARVDALVAEIGRLGAARPADQKLGNAAAIVAVLAGADRARVEQLLAIVWPFIPALFLELGSILFFAIGLPKGRAPRVDAPNVGNPCATPAPADTPPAPVQPVPPAPKGRRRSPREEVAERRRAVADFAAAFRRRHGRDPEPRDVRDALGLPRRASSDYLTAWREQNSSGVARTTQAPPANTRIVA